jgi:hypothetical protein
MGEGEGVRESEIKKMINKKWEKERNREREEEGESKKKKRKKERGGRERARFFLK